MNDFDTMSFSNGQAGSSSTGPSGSGDGGASSSSARGSGPSFPALEAGPSPSSPSPTTSKMSSPAKGKHTRTSETSSSLSASALSWPSVRAVTVEEGEHHEQDHNHESGHEHHSDEKDDRFVILVPRNLCGHHSRRCSHLPPLTRKECGCEDNFRLTATACVKPLTDVQQPVLDGWKASPEAWAATGSPLSWDSMQEMYNPKLGQPISNKVMNAFIRVVAEWGESGHLFLGTELYDTLGRFCLCSDGKCKYKGNTPLETALKAAGHEGVRLYNYHRVFFPIQHNGYWMAIMLDTTAAKNLIFAPCGGFHVFPEHFAVVAGDMVRIIVSEVTSCQPSFETVFDKQQFEIVTPETNFDTRYSALLVLTILDLFSRVGLPEYPEAAVHIFTSFSELVAMGCELDWEATITKLFDEGRHSAAYCIASPEEGEKPPKPKAKAKNKPKKTKNLKVRIADAHKGMNKPHPKPVALPPPPPKRDFCCRPPAPRPLVQPGLPKTGQHKSEDLSKSKSKSHTRTVSHCVDNLSDLVNNLSTSHHKASPTPKKGRTPPAVNMIQQSLTDRILWSISIGFPPNLPKACEEIARQALGEILDQHTSADGTHKPCSKLISGDHSSNDSECEPGESGIRCIGEAFFKILADRDADFNNKAARAKIISGMVGFEDELD